MIIRWPDISLKDKSSDDLLYNVDFAPTLCDLLGIPTPVEWDGISFKDSIKGTGSTGREYLVWDCGLYAVQRAVRTRRHLMVRTYDNCGYRFQPVELFDMENDPYQTNDLGDEHPGGTNLFRIFDNAPIQG